MKSLFEYDLKYLEQYDYLIGIDEVGRGCLAGPLVVCGIIMKYDEVIESINDSKKLTPKKRNELYQKILDNKINHFIIEVDPCDVDNDNIYQATKKAMQKIACELQIDNCLVLSDAMPLDNIEHISIIKGDETSYAIACASIIAKVYRDNLMIELASTYPEYDFENNKGYGTKKHLQALEKHGYLENIHRKSFEPIKTMCNKQMKLEI
ncbi:ribonuclease HII [Bacilli bacterium PM5-3]|nr:ribonuclease HII [Bacilli bacterium PM5-3]